MDEFRELDVIVAAFFDGASQDVPIDIVCLGRVPGVPLRDICQIGGNRICLCNRVAVLPRDEIFVDGEVAFCCREVDDRYCFFGNKGICLAGEFVGENVKFGFDC